MVHLRQPLGSQLCGHTCMAMVSGYTVEEVIEFFGHDKASRYSEYVKFLKHCGFTFPNVYIKYNNRKTTNRDPLPDLCLVRLKRKTSKYACGHLVVHYKGKIYDPDHALFESVEEMLETYNSKNRRVKYNIDWYLPLEI